MNKDPMSLDEVVAFVGNLKGRCSSELITVVIETKAGKHITGEAESITDSAIFILSDDMRERISLINIRNIERSQLEHSLTPTA